MRQTAVCTASLLAVEPRRHPVRNSKRRKMTSGDGPSCVLYASSADFQKVRAVSGARRPSLCLGLTCELWSLGCASITPNGSHQQKTVGQCEAPRLCADNSCLRCPARVMRWRVSHWQLSKWRLTEIICFIATAKSGQSPREGSRMSEC